MSNHTTFQDPEHYRALLRGEELPVETYSSFIHEATHHWCFLSPVGTALSLLYLSVARNALRWAVTGSEAKLNRALDDLLTFQVAVSWLRPLSEGLAQFAEYDVLRPERGPLTSPPMVSTLLHLFNLNDRLKTAPAADPRPAYYKLADDITRWRVSRKSIDRKSELLLQPIEAEGSGYLLGYLTVKQLWKSARRFYEELNDSDVFMMLLRKFVFGDYALAGELLDRRRPAFQRGLRFGNAVYNRLYFLRTMPFDQEEVPWSEWETILATPSAKESLPYFGEADGPPFAAMDTIKAVEKGRKLLFRYLREASAPAGFAAKKMPLFPADYFHDLVRERHLMWLGDVAAKWVSIGPQKGQILVEDAVVFDNYDLTHVSDEGLDQLKLDIYVDLYANYQVTTIANERGVFGFVTRHADGEPRRLTKLRLDRRMIAVTTDVIHGLVHGYIARTNYPDVLENFWAKGGRDLLNRTYMGFAFNFNGEAESLVGKRGIADILENDADLVRNLAAISLGASAGLSPEGLRLSSSDYPSDPLDTIRRVGKLWPVGDFPLASVDADGFLDSAF